MSARRGSLTLIRLFTKKEPPRDLRQRYLQAIRLRAFRPLKPEEESVEASGWCVLERPFDLEFDASKIYEDAYLLLGFRTDRFRVPGSMLRAELADEERRLLTRSGKNRLSRNERLELRDKIVLKLRKKLVPSTRAVDVVWLLDRGVVLFFAHSRRALADFCALFEKTFGIELDEDSPYLAAERANLAPALARQLSKIAPLNLSSGRKTAEKSHPAAEPKSTASAEPNATEEDGESSELFQRIETTRFLGPEFLLWIWLRGEFSKDNVSLGESGDFDVWLDQQISFESAFDKNERVIVRGAAPADGDEAREAVRARKLPVRARIVLQGSERDFALGLNAPRFAVQTATLPALLKTEESEAFLERMELTEALLGTLDRLFAEFLSDRLSERWSAGWEPSISLWAENQPIPASLLTNVQSRVRSTRSRDARSKKQR